MRQAMIKIQLEKTISKKDEQKLWTDNDQIWDVQKNK